MIMNGTEPSSVGREFASISVIDPEWKEQCERLANQAFEISDVRRPDEIVFIADFAARHQLTLVWRQGVFELEPRRK
jgi:hypothetical protein